MSGDLALGTPNMADKVREFKVLNDYQMESDHCPIFLIIKLSGGTRLINENNRTRYNFAKADWVLFRNFLEEKAITTSETQLCSLNVNELSALILKQILESVEKSVPKFSKMSHNCLPKEIVDLIKMKREVRKKIGNSHSENLKTYFNKLTNQVKLLIKEYREKTWKNMLDKLGPYPVSSRIFWQKINQARSNNQAVSIPKLVKDSKEYITNEEKVEVFASMLSATYAATDNESDFDFVHKNTVNKFVKKFLEKIPNDFLPFRLTK